VSEITSVLRLCSSVHNLQGESLSTVKSLTYLQDLAVIWIRCKERRQATSKEPQSSQPLPALNLSQAAMGCWQTGGFPAASSDALMTVNPDVITFLQPACSKLYVQMGSLQNLSFTYFSSPEHRIYIHDFRKCFSFWGRPRIITWALPLDPVGEFRPQTPLLAPFGQFSTAHLFHNYWIIITYQ